MPDKKEELITQILRKLDRQKTALGHAEYYINEAKANNEQIGKLMEEYQELK